MGICLKGILGFCETHSVTGEVKSPAKNRFYFCPSSGDYTTPICMPEKKPHFQVFRSTFSRCSANLPCPGQQLDPAGQDIHVPGKKPEADMPPIFSPRGGTWPLPKHLRHRHRFMFVKTRPWDLLGSVEQVPSSAARSASGRMNEGLHCRRGPARIVKTARRWGEPAITPTSVFILFILIRALHHVGAAVFLATYLLDVIPAPPLWVCNDCHTDRRSALCWKVTAAPAGLPRFFGGDHPGQASFPGSRIPSIPAGAGCGTAGLHPGLGGLSHHQAIATPVAVLAGCHPELTGLSCEIFC